MGKFIHWIGHLFGMNCAVSFDRTSDCWRCKRCKRRVSVLPRGW